MEQGQIGGEGWPSPYAARSQERALRPSGRLLESRSDPGPRGMIAVARVANRERSRGGQNPAYRLIRYFLLH